MKVLLPVDQSQASVKAVLFAAKLLAGHKGEAKVTLLHVAESIPDFLLAGRGGQSAQIYGKVVEDWEAEQKSSGEALLEGHRKSLVDAGLSASAVQTKLVVRESRPEACKVVAALSIIEEMQAGNYSVVCLGRRGSTAAEGAFPGSVAEKVLREAAGRTVWVVD